jgi:scyllo-inositol 2-dehydrogenase (NADP+)
MPDLRVAIIGYGLAGRFFHAPLIDATPGLVLATVVTSSAERRTQVEREHPDARVLTSPEQLWARGDHELVVVAAPNDAHAALAAAAIDLGLAVVVEKPLAVSAAEAEGLVTRAEQAGVLLTVFQNRRWDSDHLTVARLLAEQRLGAVLRYESRFERWRPLPRSAAWRESSSPEQGGGVLLDIGSHLIDQALLLFGPPTHIYAEIAERRGTPADDDAFLALQHPHGVISHLHASAMTAAPGPRLRVLGTEAAYIASYLDSQEAALRAGTRPDTKPDWGAEPHSHWGRLLRGDDGEVVPSERGNWPRFYVLLATALRDRGAPPVDPRDGVATLCVAEHARRSAAGHTVVAFTN